MHIYLSSCQNHSIDSKTLKAIALVTLELSIKNNEDKVISFDECSKVLVNDRDYTLHHMNVDEELKCV